MKVLESCGGIGGAGLERMVSTKPEHSEEGAGRGQSKSRGALYGKGLLQGGQVVCRASVFDREMSSGSRALVRI